MKWWTASLLAVLPLAGLASCGNPSVKSYSGLEEPLVVQGGTFLPGPLPQGVDGPSVLTIDSPNNLLVRGRSSYAFSGDAATGATAVGLQLEGVGSGYWVVPVTDLDPQTKGGITWRAVCDISQAVPLGPRALQFVAVTADGHYGPLKTTNVRVDSNVPDGFVVVSLVWDTNADLDLHVVAPSGKQLDPKHRHTGVFDDAGTLSPGSGELDRDSNASCIPDGYRQEDVVWNDVPEAGTYRVLVDEFDACQTAATRFTLTIYVGGEVRIQQSGIVLDLAADQGAPGLFVTDFQI